MSQSRFNQKEEGLLPKSSQFSMVIWLNVATYVTARCPNYKCASTTFMSPKCTDICEAFSPFSSFGFTIQKYFLPVDEFNMNTYLQGYLIVNHKVNGCVLIKKPPMPYYHFTPLNLPKLRFISFLNVWS